jgi:hypothetical protein
VNAAFPWLSDALPLAEKHALREPAFFCHTSCLLLPDNSAEGCFDHDRSTKNI